MNGGLTAARTVPVRTRRAGRRAFIRHFGEMLLAMFIGMALLGGVAQLAFVAADSSLGQAAGVTQVLVMFVCMTVPMVAWMVHRGHGRARSAEMAAAMAVPSLIAAALAAAGALEAQAALGVQHATMIPAMLGVMLWRHAHYARGARTVGV